MAKNFRTLSDKVLSDPTRRERVDKARQEAIAEHVEYSLNELRRLRGFTQVELAQSLQTMQPGVSRIENSDDVLISTLSKYVEALGGHLEVTAVFGDNDERVPIRVGDVANAEVR